MIFFLIKLFNYVIKNSKILSNEFLRIFSPNFIMSSNDIVNADNEAIIFPDGNDTIGLSIVFLM
jgi:hypothetical protein